MKLPCLIITLLSSFYANTQVLRHPLPFSYQAFNAYSKKFTDVYSAINNQASVAQLETAGFAVYGERRFMLNELKAFTFVLAAPTKSGTIGVQGDYFGSAGFNQNQLGVLYARKITKAIDLGVKFNYYSVRIAGYGNASTVNFEAGAIVHFSENLHAGLHVYNPSGSKLGKSGSESIAHMYKLGLGYEASRQLLVSIELVKEQQQRVGVNSGVQYNLHEKVSLKAGVSTLSNNIYAGISYQFAFAQVHFYTAYHQQLGLTPGILLSFSFNKNEQE